MRALEPAFDGPGPHDPILVGVAVLAELVALPPVMATGVHGLLLQPVAATTIIVTIVTPMAVKETLVKATMATTTAALDLY